MENLSQAKQNLVYQISNITGSDALKKQLTNLGVVKDQKIVIIDYSKHDAILLLKNSRVAVSREVLHCIQVKKPAFDQESWYSLDTLRPADKGYVVAIHGQGMLKRRLMDMGVTKGVLIEVKKLAPLGDPIDIRLRGYELSLRKSEAAMILVQKEGEIHG